jgi:hypothetical protein
VTIEPVSAQIGTVTSWHSHTPPPWARPLAPSMMMVSGNEGWALGGGGQWLDPPRPRRAGSSSATGARRPPIPLAGCSIGWLTVSAAARSSRTSTPSSWATTLSGAGPSRRRKSRSAFSDGAAHPGQPARRSACPAPVGARRSLASRYARTLVRRADAARAGWLRDGPPGGTTHRAGCPMIFAQLASSGWVVLRRGHGPHEPLSRVPDKYQAGDTRHDGRRP